MTDAGLMHLAGLQNLDELVLFDTQVTESGVKRLRKTLPAVRVYRRDGKHPAYPEGQGPT